MSNESKKTSDSLQRILDAFPALSMVVDEDVSVIAFNTAASRELDLDENALRKLTGDVLGCSNAWHGGGCGRTRKCKNCEVRLAIGAASSGSVVERKMTTMHLRVGGVERDVHLLVSATPVEHDGRYRVLLIIENVTELYTLRRLLGVCSSCGRTRDDVKYRNDVEQYILAHPNSAFPYGVCYVCALKEPASE
jgi:hypothetical protein